MASVSRPRNKQSDPARPEDRNGRAGRTAVGGLLPEPVAVGQGRNGGPLYRLLPQQLPLPRLRQGRDGLI
jgi:hypothetical protein